MNVVTDRKHRIIEDPPFIQRLFNDTQISWIWLPVRLWVAFQWLTAAWSKLNNPEWMQTGAALQGFWTNALRTDPRPAIAFDWYRAFIQMLLDSGSAVWFAKVITFGELFVGLGLLLGAFTGMAAFGGLMMNLNYMLAGSAATNPVLFTLEIMLLMAWKVAGYYDGLDRFLLPRLGVPWRLKHHAPAETVDPNPLKPVAHIR